MRSAKAIGGLGLVVSGHVCVEHLKTVVAEAVLAVAPLRARAGGGRGRVQEEVHLAVAAKVGDEDLLHIWKQDGRVARVARKAGVGRIFFGQLPANVVDGTDLVLVQSPSSIADCAIAAIVEIAIGVRATLV